MRCVINRAGQALGVYRVGSDVDALDELARDRGFADFPAWAEASAAIQSHFVVLDALRMLHTRGRAVFGPVAGEYAWFPLPLPVRGMDQPYLMRPADCSAFYPTMAEATLRGLQE